MNETGAMHWRIVSQGKSPGALPGRLPGSILTLAPGLLHYGMPNEIGLLLPSNPGPKGLLDRVVSDSSLCSDCALGLFLGGPFLNLEREGPRLRKAGVGWVANLPSVAQQDEDFAEQLADVALDHGRELAALALLKQQGFQVAAAVADAEDAGRAAAISPQAMIVLPRVGDFAAGFPSLRQRGAAAQAVRAAAERAGWYGALLGLADAREADHRALWPDSLDGVVCRPTIA